jgi:isopentenyldiphosphate isomerase
VTEEVQGEVVDVYDDDGALIGTALRKRVHHDGSWHRCFHCVVVARRDAAVTLTLQRRGMDLDEYPGRIDVSVAGHLSAGESVADAARREIAEELGVDVPTNALERVGDYDLIVNTEQFFSREHTDVYVLRDDRLPSQFPFDPAELASLVSVGLDQAVALWTGTRTSIAATEWTPRTTNALEVTIDDFVKDVPDYWPWLAAALGERFASVSR